jgi:uncharacterized protein YbjT (DUF2867 family)
MPEHLRALPQNLKKAQTMPGVAWVAGDLAKPESLLAAFDGATTVFLLTHYLEDMVESPEQARVRLAYADCAERGLAPSPRYGGRQFFA